MGISLLVDNKRLSASLTQSFGVVLHLLQFDGYRCKAQDISPCRGFEDVDAEWTQILPAFSGREGTD